MDRPGIAGSRRPLASSSSPSTRWCGIRCARRRWPELLRRRPGQAGRVGVGRRYVGASGQRGRAGVEDPCGAEPLADRLVAGRTPSTSGRVSSRRTSCSGDRREQSADVALAPTAAQLRPLRGHLAAPYVPVQPAFEAASTATLSLWWDGPKRYGT